MRCKIPEGDLVQRLDNTICLYKNQPVFVRVDGRSLLLRTVVGNKGIGNIMSDDPDFDISTVPLGYVQYRERTFYVGRRPVRIFKQAFCADNMSSKLIDGNPDGIVGQAIIRTSGFEDMVLGIYPSVDVALNKLWKEKKEQEIAISREVALKFNPSIHITYIYYKTIQVGFILPEQKRVIIPSNDFGWVVSRYLEGFSWEVE